MVEIEGKDFEVWKRWKIESSYGLEGYEVFDEVYFVCGNNVVNFLGCEGFVEY